MEDRAAHFCHGVSGCRVNVSVNCPVFNRNKQPHWPRTPLPESVAGASRKPRVEHQFLFQFRFVHVSLSACLAQIRTFAHPSNRLFFQLTTRLRESFFSLFSSDAILWKLLKTVKNTAHRVSGTGSHWNLILKNSGLFFFSMTSDCCMKMQLIQTENSLAHFNNAFKK